jgi:hypothetical protein
VVEYKRNDKDEIVKVTTRIETSVIEKRVYKVSACASCLMASRHPVLHMLAASACVPAADMCKRSVTSSRASTCQCFCMPAIAHRSMPWDTACFTASHASALHLHKSQLERRKWERFGNPLKESDNDSVTVRAREDIHFEHVRLQKSTREEKKTAVDVATALAMGNKFAVGTRCAIVNHSGSSVRVVAPTARICPIRLGCAGFLALGNPAIKPPCRLSTAVT